MKKLTTMLALALCTTTSVWAQRTPEHPLDIKDVTVSMHSFFDAWEIGIPPGEVTEMDEQFYISRVRPLARIDEGDYRIHQNVDPGRKMCLWVPLDDPSTKWKALPRYCLEGDNFSMWSYLDIHGNWTAPWVRVSAGMTDAAHKNGVKVGCVLSVPFAAYLSPYGTDDNSRNFRKLIERNDDDTFKNSRKLVEIMKYYGIDGLGCNSEFRSTTGFMSDIIDFFADCHVKAKEIGWDFQLHWYDGTNEGGSYQFDRGLGSHNEKMFGNGEKVVTDMMFANYNWSDGLLKNSVAYAEKLNRNSYDYYAGFDIQGRAYKAPWKALLNNKISIGFWGAHAQSLLHQSATDDGTSDIAIQKAYLQKQELTFSGGYRNPGLLPSVREDATLANSDLKTFHGLATFISAKSTLQQLPFVTRFSLGNGLTFKKEGKTVFDHKWYNLGMQDFLPTWRWWITDRQDVVTTENVEGLVKADLVFEDAWFGGSCMKLHGKTEFSRVKLFKTKFDIQPDYTISITYKTLNGTGTNAKLFVAKGDALNQYKEISIPAAANQGEWTTFTAKLSDLGLQANDVVAMLGISVENTPEDYAMLVGELSVINPGQTFTTVKPDIKEVEILRGRYNALDFKVRYASREEAGGVKTYNDEVGTWYYEIYFQQQGQAEQLLTATPSWAAYVIDAPVVPGMEGREGRFGVRAVSPDGKNGSAIAWTEYQEIPYNEPSSKLIINKPVIKPNESFVIKFEDTMQKPAQKWEVKDPLTGTSMGSVSNASELELSIAKVGLYDLYITNSEGDESITRGFVQITPESTGAMPQILTFASDIQKAETDKEVKFSYTSKDGEGRVSRGLKIVDPNMFMVPGEAQTTMTYSYAVWFKVESYSHDKQGTNLINKNTIADSWPHNNWGDLWVTIRPEWGKHAANEVSFNTMGWTAHDSPNEDMMSTGYSITPNVWNHLVVTQENKLQKMYLNGKKLAETTFNASTRRENSSDSRIDKTAVANIFFGGGGVYKSGFNGWIDEVQVWNKALTDEEVLACMNGYEDAPEGLIAYYTFENKAEDETFANLGKGGDLKGKVVVMEGSGGEGTSSASYVQKAADNQHIGYPGIPGSLEIKTAPEWNLAGATLPAETNGKELKVTYKTAGTFNAGLMISNLWGKDSENLAEYITIVQGGTGIDKFDAELGLSVYPNPFVESVNMKFLESGEYSVNILDVKGNQIKSIVLKANEGEIVNVSVEGGQGMYLLQVMKDGKLYRTLKLVKK